MRQDKPVALKFTSAQIAGQPRPMWMESALTQLNAIAALPEGWDSNKCSRPDPKLIHAATALLQSLSNAGEFPKPAIHPTRSGGVQFEWESNGRYLEIEVVAERAATYFYQDIAAHIEEEGELFEGEGPERMLSYIVRATAA